MVRRIWQDGYFSACTDSLQPAFVAINLEPEENVDDQIDTTKELHVRSINVASCYEWQLTLKAGRRGTQALPTCPETPCPRSSISRSCRGCLQRALRVRDIQISRSQNRLPACRTSNQRRGRLSRTRGFLWRTRCCSRRCRRRRCKSCARALFIMEEPRTVLSR